jgi:hypothetical protein
MYGKCTVEPTISASLRPWVESILRHGPPWGSFSPANGFEATRHRISSKIQGAEFLLFLMVIPDRTTKFD